MSTYLDYAATTPADERVIACMNDCMRSAWANPSAAYSDAGPARKALRMARSHVAALLHCDPSCVAFTSGGTESNAWAMTAAAGKHAVVSAIEHASVLEAVRKYAAGITLVQPDASGVIRPDAVAAAIRPDTALVSVQWANNETGVLQPIREIRAVTKKIPLHVDAVQAFGHVPVDASLCDLMSLSAHKLYGPRGAGALYIAPGMRLAPMIPGGHQEMNLRAGTENVPAIAGFGEAARLAAEDLPERAEHERALMAEFIGQLQIPGLRVLGEGAPRLPGVTALYLPNLPSEKAIMKMDLRGFCLSGGAACHAGDGTPSHVYRAMGLSEKDAACVVRVSIGRGTTKQALAACAQALEEVWKQG
ncbi:MAG: cysteine desulfurase family protein [bacterium]|nr:cysteine desulfurase family protein [bacterium]